MSPGYLVSKKQNKQKHSGNTEQTSPGGNNCLDLSSRWDTIKEVMTTTQTFEFAFPESLV